MRCWDGKGQYCGRTAEYILENTGVPIPGGYMCREHAQAVLDEYKGKLGWHWEGHPVDEFGRRNPLQPPLLPQTG